MRIIETCASRSYTLRAGLLKVAFDLSSYGVVSQLQLGAQKAGDGQNLRRHSWHDRVGRRRLRGGGFEAASGADDSITVSPTILDYHGGYLSTRIKDEARAYRLGPLSLRTWELKSQLGLDQGQCPLMSAPATQRPRQRAPRTHQELWSMDGARSF